MHRSRNAHLDGMRSRQACAAELDETVVVFQVRSIKKTWVYKGETKRGNKVGRRASFGRGLADNRKSRTISARIIDHAVLLQRYVYSCVRATVVSPQPIARQNKQYLKITSLSLALLRSVPPSRNRFRVAVLGGRFRGTFSLSFVLF